MRACARLGGPVGRHNHRHSGQALMIRRGCRRKRQDKTNRKAKQFQNPSSESGRRRMIIMFGEDRQAACQVKPTQPPTNQALVTVALWFPLAAGARIRPTMLTTTREKQHRCGKWQQMYIITILITIHSFIYFLLLLSGPFPSLVVSKAPSSTDTPHSAAAGYDGATSS